MIVLVLQISSLYIYDIIYNMELVPNNKGGHKLLYEDCMYTKKASYKTTVRWECSQKCSKQCKGSLTTDTEMARVIRSSAPSHNGSKVTVAAVKVRTTLKDQVSTSRWTPAQLLADHTASVPVEVRAAIGQRESVKCTVCREKAKPFLADPRSLSDLEIPQEWTLTSDGKPFLIHDSGADSSERMLVFASEVGLTQLAQADTDVDTDVLLESRGQPPKKR